MGMVSIEELCAGMELQSPLKSRQGRQLLPSGITLTDKHIRTLKVWGIVEADIVDHGETETSHKKLDELPPDLVEKAKHHTLGFFQLADTKHPVVRSLAKLHLTRTANALYFDNNWHQAFVPPDGEPRASSNGDKRPALEAALDKGVELASLPEVFNRIIEAVNDPMTSAGHIAEVISMDTSLSAKLLRLVNSPYYGFSEQVDTLTRALALVGTDKLTQLAMGISLVNAFKDIDADLFDMRSFWEHSITCGLTAGWLASQDDAPREESYFIAGLIHDIGWLIMLKLYPDASHEVLHRRKTDSRASFKLEKECWGFDHAELGAMVLREWALPESLVQAVMHHHTPQAVKYETGPSLIHVADFAAHALNTRPSFTPVPPLRGGAWASLGFSHNVFGPMATQVDAQLSDILGVFFNE